MNAPRPRIYSVQVVLPRVGRQLDVPLSRHFRLEALARAELEDLQREYPDACLVERWARVRGGGFVERLHDEQIGLMADAAELAHRRDPSGAAPVPIVRWEVVVEGQPFLVRFTRASAEQRLFELSPVYPDAELREVLIWDAPDAEVRMAAAFREQALLDQIGACYAQELASAQPVEPQPASTDEPARTVTTWRLVSPAGVQLTQPIYVRVLAEALLKEPVDLFQGARIVETTTALRAGDRALFARSVAARRWGMVLGSAVIAPPEAMPLLPAAPGAA